MALDTFNPVKYSLEENRFLLAHLGEPSSIALKATNPVPLPNPARDSRGNITDRNPIYYPDGVIPASVKPILDTVYELEDLRTRYHQPWVGIEKVKERIQIYLDAQEKWIADKRRFKRAPRFPTMHSYDAKGKPHRGGPGSDSGQVRTYFDADGNRHEFVLDLLQERATGDWAPEWIEPPTPSPRQPLPDTKKVTDDVDNHRLECPVCKHTESYKVDSQSSHNAARGRMSKHLRTETKEVALHRELYTNEYGN